MTIIHNEILFCDQFVLCGRNWRAKFLVIPSSVQVIRKLRYGDYIFEVSERKLSASEPMN
jgi:hypothetical protein